jgi:3'-phosphoadenosine 5'-phosphosulfate sulfotransferase (PAPS reductase)/FAD synthetase
MMNDGSTAAVPNLADYDYIVINTSAGKDSQAMMEYVVRLADEAGVRDRVVAVHCDLSRVEWKGTRELADLHCNLYYHIPLFVVHREKGDLLDQVEARGMWPDSGNRYCTSDQKRDQVAKLHTKLVSESNISGRQVKILNCMGLRAEESPARAKKTAFEVNKRQTNGKRLVMDWLPIHTWTTVKVWEVIEASGVPHHYAYDLGMPRLSCVFCIFAPKDALVVAGKHNPELLDEYIRVEAKIDHTFKNGFKIAEIRDLIQAGYQPKNLQSWVM